MDRIVSLRDLSSRLGVPQEELEALAEAGDANYTRQPKFIKGKIRICEVPCPPLMEVQRRITSLLSDYPLSPVAYGAVKGQSARKNAEQHLGKRVVVTLDIKGFFPNTSWRRIFNMFRRDFGFGEDVASLLTRLTTYSYHLPQGAATSPTLANALLTKPIDAPLAELAKANGVTPSRYVDDFAFSGDNPLPMINETARRLSPLGLRMDRDAKLKIMRSNKVQRVTGLNVNNKDKASVGQPYIDKVRAAIHQLQTVPKIFQANARDSILGRIQHVRHTNPGAAKRLERQFQAQEHILQRS
jgi:RNA-directed DNA polymerase